MLTQVEWTTLKFVLKVICNSHATPFDWDSNGSVLLPTKSKFKICMSFLILLTVVTYGAFDMARLPETYHRPGGNGGDVVMHSILCLWYVNVALWQLIVSFGCRQEFAALFNQQVNFNFCKGPELMSFEFLPQRRREIFYRGGLLSNLQTAFIWTTLTVLQKDKYFFVFSALPEGWKTPKVLAALSVGEFLFVASYFMTGYLLVNIAYTYFICSKFWLKTLCVKWPTEQLSSGASREVRQKRLDTSFKMYRNMELLNKLFNDCFASWIIPELKVFATFTVSMCVYGIIKFRGRIHPMMECMFAGCVQLQLGILLSICVAGANFLDNTKRFHTNYGYVMMQFPLESQKYYKKVALACSPFGFRVGNYYVIKKITVASVLYLLLNIIMFLLLTY